MRALSKGEVPDPRGGAARAGRRGPGARGRLRFVVGATNAARTAEFVFLCVQTPQSESGAADLSAVEAVVHEIAPVLRAGHRRGQQVDDAGRAPRSSSPGTSAEAGASNDVGVASNPEFLREGTAVRDFLEPSRVVIGCDDTAVAVRVSDLYRDVQAPILVTDPASAEMIKYASNAFLATKISFINAIANLCEAVNADVREVALGMGYDPRIGFEFLHPGPGLRRFVLPEGHRRAHPHRRHRRLRLQPAARRRRREPPPARAHHREAARRAPADRSRDVPVGVWGLTFKANTDDLRDSPALVVCRRLLEEGARVRAYDPAAGEAARRAAPGPRRRRPIPYDAVRDAQLLALLTEWDEFRWLDFGRVADAMARAARAGRRPQPARPGGHASARLRLPGRRALMPRAVVTGGAGFLGFAPLRPAPRARLGGRRGRQLPHRATATTSRTSPTTPASRSSSTTSSTASRSTAPVDAVLHLASPASPPEYLAHPIATLEVGSIGTRHALDLARAHGARFLLASTSEIYGDPLVHPQPESYFGNVNSVGPRSVYDEAKRYAEAITMAYHREFGVDTKIVRIFNTYGPRLGAADGRVVSNFLAQAMRGEPLTVYGDGKQTRSFCFVSDEVDGLLALLESDHVGPMNIGNPDEFTMLELAELVLEVTGADQRPRVRAAADRRSPSSAGPTSRSPSGCSAGIRRSTSAKVSPARTTGTGGSVSPDETHDYRKLSVIVPVFDERNTVVEIVRRMRAVDLPVDLEIVIVDDGSTDGTRDVLRQLGDSTVRVITHEANRGKGAAIRSGLAHVTGDLVLVQDADLEYDPEDWPKLLAPILRGKARVVYGSRFTGERRNMLFLHWVGNRFLSLVTNVLYNTTLSDMETCYKLFDRDAARRHHAAGAALRVRARGHGQDPAARHPHLRGADLLHRSRVRRGQEDHLARRLHRALDPRQVPLRGLMTSPAPPPGRRWW